MGLTILSLAGGWEREENVLLGEKKERAVLERLCKDLLVIRDINQGYTRRKCSAGCEEFYVTCYGDIIPCAFIQISFGNIKTESVKKIWQKMNMYLEFRISKTICRSGEDIEFIDKYLKPLVAYRNLPISIEEFEKR